MEGYTALVGGQVVGGVPRGQVVGGVPLHAVDEGTAQGRVLSNRFQIPSLMYVFLDGEFFLLIRFAGRRRTAVLHVARQSISPHYLFLPQSVLTRCSSC